jgi:thioredoxin reductase
MRDLIVIGGGPAGLTATVYAVQKGLDVLLVTRDLGGKTNYRLQLPFVERHMVINGDEVVNRFTREVEYLDYVRSMGNAERIEPAETGYQVTVSGEGEIPTHCVIVATGARGQLLDIPGEKEFMMRGLCYSALSYAQLFIDRKVIVIGDGHLALRSVAELARIAKHVVLVAPTEGELGSPLGQRLQERDSVEFLVGYHAAEVKGDSYARSLLVSNGGGTRELEGDAIFVEMDLIPRSKIVADLVELDDKMRIKVNARNETREPKPRSALTNT